MEQVGHLLDTPAKKSLWFYLIPILEEPHQKFAQKRLNEQYVVASSSTASDSSLSKIK
jgi:hypothetical protein